MVRSVSWDAEERGVVKFRPSLEHSSDITVRCVSELRFSVLAGCLDVGVCDEVDRMIRDLYPLRRCYPSLDYCKHAMSRMSRLCRAVESEHVDTECCRAWLVRHDLE